MMTLAGYNLVRLLSAVAIIKVVLTHPNDFILDESLLFVVSLVRFLRQV